MSLIKYLGRRALLNVIIIINIYSFNLGAYKKMLIFILWSRLSILLYTTHNVVQMAEIIFVKAESPFPD